MILQNKVEERKMQFCIQDPSYEKSKYLHETLIAECLCGYAGAGAYAFATKDGIELFLEDENFAAFMKNGKFFLVVGMDDITNVNSIETLRKIKEKYKGNLTIKAYIHNSKGSTFHPKYSWFEKKDGGTLILGSGNLTQKGLRHNREAYSVINYDKEGMQGVKQEWNDWIIHSEPFLFDISDDIVIEQAKQNTKKLRAIYEVQQASKSGNHLETYSALAEIFKSQPKDKKFKTSVNKDRSKVKNEKDIVKTEVEEINDEIDVDLSYWCLEPECEVLLAEIPKNGDRMSQVNFDKKSFEEFFGATCGENGVYRILFRNVNTEGALQDIEVRPSVSVESHNYRFELDAAKGVKYPKDGNRPIGVFAKVSHRDFLYELIMPDDSNYQYIIEVMNAKKAASASMRRLRYIGSEIFDMTRGLAIWKRLEENDEE